MSFSHRGASLGSRRCRTWREGAPESERPRDSARFGWLAVEYFFPATRPFACYEGNARTERREGYSVARQPIDAVLWADAREEDGVIDEEVTEPGLWKRNGWIAKVIKNPDDDGWAVEMTRIGDDEPALVGPWTMGRDKKNPKPLDNAAFLTLVKTASEVLRRHEQSARARLHRSITFVDDAPSATGGGLRIRADLDLTPDDDDPHAILALFDDATSEPIRSGRVAASFKLDAANVKRWMQSNGE